MDCCLPGPICPRKSLAATKNTNVAPGIAYRTLDARLDPERPFQANVGSHGCQGNMPSRPQVLPVLIRVTFGWRPIRGSITRSASAQIESVVRLSLCW